MFEPCGLPYFLDVVQPIRNSFEVGTWDGSVTGDTWSNAGLVFENSGTTISPVENIQNRTSIRYLVEEKINHTSSWDVNGSITFESV